MTRDELLLKVATGAILVARLWRCSRLSSTPSRSGLLLSRFLLRLPRFAPVWSGRSGESAKWRTADFHVADRLQD